MVFIFLAIASTSVAQQQDTIIYRHEFNQLAAELRDTQHNIALYSRTRREAYAFALGSVLGTMAVTGYNMGVTSVDQQIPELYLIPAIVGVVSIVKFISAEKYLKRIEVTAGGVRVKF